MTCYEKLKYKLSSDYVRLKTLLDDGLDIVCFVTYDFFQHSPDHKPMIVKDVAIIRKLNDGIYDIGVRGNGYGSTSPEFNITLENLCKIYKLEYIDII